MVIADGMADPLLQARAPYDLLIANILAGPLVSMATGRQVRSDVGMTGEVTLNGRVLPIGGVKQKLLAAQRNGLKTIFIPQRNEPDLDDVPAEVLDALDVKPMVDVAEIVALALEPVSEGAQVAA